MELSWLVTAILGATVLIIFYWLGKKNSEYWVKRGVPYFQSPPIIGVLKDIILMKKGMGDIFTEIYHQFDGEKFCGYHQLLTPVIMIRDPELINQVLIKDFTHFEDRGPPIKKAGDIFSLSLSNLTGDEWRNVRHKLTPTFTSGKLKMMFGAIKGCGDEVVDHLKTREGESFDARDFMFRYVVNVIGNIAFGLKINTLDENDERSKDFYQRTSGFFKPSVGFLLKMFIIMSLPKVRDALRLKMIANDIEIFFKNLTKDIIKTRETSETKRNDFLHLMLDLKRRERENLSNGVVDEKNNSFSVYENEQLECEDKELMDQLKNTPIGSSSSKISETFTDEFIASQTFLFISGGTETTAAVLSFVLYELAANQDLQKKVQSEISDALSYQSLNYEAVKRMTYMEQFINETLRLHPIAGILMRLCTSDYKIPGTGVVIEKGTFVQIPVIALHKDPQYFPDPEKFDPDRFENMEAVPKGVYFSFGAGPRICIAMRLAMLEMKVIIASLLQNYSVILSEKTKLPLKIKKNSAFLHAEGGIWMKFQKRETLSK